ncbi:MAG: carbamate kinase [Planctomycetota bacterium]|nr:carbamate kinase [Planctomycetota bacterium]
MKRLVIALGGNAILQFGQQGTVEEQTENLRVASRRLAPIIGSWYQVVLTHGNGPQVGNLLIQQQSTKEVPPMPLDVCGAQTQGQIGYLLQKILFNELRRMGKKTKVATVPGMMMVKETDPAFEKPSKPVGPWFTHEEMLESKNEGETWTEHPQKGWRKVVPSPRPIRIINSKSIQTLLRNGQVVIACGGGGIPVVETRDGSLQGREAVIDKDLAAERLATGIQAHILMILTDVSAVYADYGTPNEKPIHRIDVKDMRELLEKDIFPAGSIGPKVESAIRFVENGGEKAIIASLQDAEDALKGKTGTIVVRE